MNVFPLSRNMSPGVTVLPLVIFHAFYLYKNTEEKITDKQNFINKISKNAKI